ncbi:hypothetical protein DSECCO2_450290 [anaerobic digester metagenome]
MPAMATWTRGRVVVRRALPSLVMMPMLPVAAMAKLAPEMPMSAWQYLGRSSRRATLTSFWMSTSCCLWVTSVKRSATW